MWANFLQFVPTGGVPLNELAPLVPSVDLTGLCRLCYLRLMSDPAVRTPAPDTVARLTRQGTKAAAVWSGLADEIEQRWRTRPPYLTQSKAFVAEPWRLPAQPMVLHRGGNPDGS